MYTHYGWAGRNITFRILCCLGLQASTWSLGMCTLRMGQLPQSSSCQRSRCMWPSYEPWYKDRGEDSGLSCCVMGFADSTLFWKPVTLSIPFTLCVTVMTSPGSCTAWWLVLEGPHCSSLLARDVFVNMVLTVALVHPPHPSCDQTPGASYICSIDSRDWVANLH